MTGRLSLELGVEELDWPVQSLASKAGQTYWPDLLASRTSLAKKALTLIPTETIQNFVESLPR